MALLTRWGGIVGYEPKTAGRIFFIAPSASYTVDGRAQSASNDNDGLHPERAILTINRFVALATANVGDVGVLLPGTHTMTATQTIDKAGLTILGAGTMSDTWRQWIRPRATLTIRGTADELLNITANNTEIGNLTLQGTNDFSLVSFQTAAAGIDNLYFHDCFFDLAMNGTLSRNSRGVDFANRAGGQGTARMGTVEVGLGNGATAYLDNCTFFTNGAIGEAILLATCSVTANNCRFHNDAGTWATPVGVATNVDNTFMNACIWTTSGTMTLAMAGPQFNYAADIADSVHVSNCRFAANVGTVETVAGAKATIFDGFGTQAASLRLSENYAFGGGGSFASGGLLVDRTT